MFEATVGASYDADIAIDDIVVTSGVCPSPSPTPTPNPCAVKCRSGKCIDSTKVCDFVSDCGIGDNSDERNCGDCTFEQG